MQLIAPRGVFCDRNKFNRTEYGRRCSPLCESQGRMYMVGVISSRLLINRKTLMEESPFNRKLVTSAPSLHDLIASTRAMSNTFCPFNDDFKATFANFTISCFGSRGALPGRYFAAQCRFWRHRAMYSLGKRSFNARLMCIVVVLPPTDLEIFHF